MQTNSKESNQILKKYACTRASCCKMPIVSEGGLIFFCHVPNAKKGTRCSSTSGTDTHTPALSPTQSRCFLSLLLSQPLCLPVYPPRIAPRARAASLPVSFHSLCTPRHKRSRFATWHLVQPGEQTDLSACVYASPDSRLYNPQNLFISPRRLSSRRDPPSAPLFSVDPRGRLASRESGDAWRLTDLDRQSSRAAGILSRPQPAPAAAAHHTTFPPCCPSLLRDRFPCCVSLLRRGFRSNFVLGPTVLIFEFCPQYSTIVCECLLNFF